MNAQSILYGNETIQYEVCYTPHRRTNIAVHVHPNGSIQVDAPDGRSLTEIRNAVRKRARWIQKHVAEANRQREHLLPREYVSGESLFYLGRRHQLKVVASETGQSVKLLRGVIRVETQSPSKDAVKKLVKAWYRSRANVIFERRLEAICNSVVWLNSPPAWKLLAMKKQWGSCSPKGVIQLNPHLVKAPRECIDYVIRHEICHIKHHDHSPQFYRQLTQLMPDWKPIKGKLDGMAEMLLNE